MDGIYDWLHLYKFIVLTLVILALSVLFVFVFRSKKWNKSTITILAFIILSVFVLSGQIYGLMITPYSYPCNIDKALVTELEDTLDKYKDISRLNGVVAYEAKSHREAMNDINHYITSEDPTGITTDADSAEAFLFLSDDYAVYCTPITREENDLFFPTFCPYYYVSMSIVYKNYRFSLSDSSIRLSQADMNVALEKLITYLKLTNQ